MQADLNQVWGIEIQTQLKGNTPLEHCVCKSTTQDSTVPQLYTRRTPAHGPQSFALRKLQMVDLCSVCLKAPSCHMIRSHDVDKELTGVSHGVLEGLATGGELRRDRGELSARRSPRGGATAP